MSKISSFADKISLSDLVCENITIPNYQRPYVWDTERVKILLEDLDEYFQTAQKDKPEKYLLGSLILHKEGDKIEVVDGQQRLISLALILRVLGIENAFLSNSTFTHSDSKAHIKENYEFIKSWFEARHGKKQIFAQNLCEKVEFIYVKAPNLDSAFIFFDSANAKGKRLEGYDLIKAFHLRALEDCGAKVSTAYFAKEFERLAADSANLKILFNETLTPARQWIRHNSNDIPSKMDIYGEFCAEIPKRFKRESTPLIAKDSLGILQNFVGGVDFFEYLNHFYGLYEKLQSIEFYKQLEAIDWANGFIYNRYVYIMAVLIYLDKFPNGRVDYMLRLIARAVFALRCSESRIRKESARDFAKEILPLIYYASVEQEIEANLCSFIDSKLSNERKFKDNEIGGGKGRYIEIMSGEYVMHKIQAHTPKGE